MSLTHLTSLCRPQEFKFEPRYVDQAEGSSYTGGATVHWAQRALATISPTNQGPNSLSDVLKKLSILPARFQEVKRSSARAGALTALSRSKAWVPELDLADVAKGYPSLKEDGALFDQDDFAACVRGVRPHATILGEETNIDKYQPGFDVDNKKMATPSYKATDLILPVRQHTFAPEIDPASLIDDEAEFVALHGFDWSKPSFQPVEGDEPAREES